MPLCTPARRDGSQPRQAQMKMSVVATKTLITDLAEIRLVQLILVCLSACGSEGRRYGSPMSLHGWARSMRVGWSGRCDGHAKPITSAVDGEP
jgi:hypothetical protein